MSAIRVAERYAKSIIDLAKEQNNLQDVVNDMKCISQMITDSRDFQMLLKNPILSVGKKQSVLRAVIQKAEVTELSSRFVLLLTKKRRENILLSIATSIIDQYNEMQGTVVAELVVTEEANEAVLTKIKDIVQQKTKAKTIELNQTIDASIIGGFILKFGDQVLDTSVKNKLNTIKKQFAEA